MIGRVLTCGVEGGVFPVHDSPNIWDDCVFSVREDDKVLHYIINIIPHIYLRRLGLAELRQTSYGGEVASVNSLAFLRRTHP